MTTVIFSPSAARAPKCGAISEKRIESPRPPDEINRTPDGFLERSTLIRFIRCNWSQILRGITINVSLTADKAMALSAYLLDKKVYSLSYGGFRI